MASVSLRTLRNQTRGGFLLTDALSAFLIALCIVPLCLACIMPLRDILAFQEEVMDEIAALQLRRVFLLSEDIEVYDSYVTFTYQEREMELTRTNRNIIMTPGTQIYFPDIDSCRFENENGLLWIIYERDDTENRKVLASLP